MRKTLAIIMMIAMVFCYMPLTGFADTEVSTTSVNTSGFIDMPNNWSTEALSKAVGNGLLEGFKEKSGTFIKPSDPLTRAQMATIVNRAFGAKGTANLTGVKDVPQKAWYTAEMQKAVKMGTMKLDSKMRPNDPITRQEAFTVLARAFKMADGTMANLEKFSDKEKVSSWAVSSLGALARVGYIQGADGKLNPLSKITRAEFAVVMDNMIKEYINKAGTVTQVHEGNLMINVPDVILKDITVKGDLILGDGIGEGNVTLENVIVKGNLIARGGGVNSIIIVGGGVDGKIVIAKVDGQVRVSVEGGAEVEVIVIDDGKDDVIIEGTVGTVEVTAPDTPVIVQNATVTNIEIKSEGAANVTVASNSTVTNVVVGTGSTGTTLNVEGRVTNVETSAANTNVGGTGTVTTVTAKEGANNTAVTTPSTKVNNDGATGVTAGGGTEVPSGSTATNSNTGGEATVVTTPTGGGSTGSGSGSGDTVVNVSAISVVTDPVDVSGLSNYDEVTVILATSTNGASIYYTTDGTTPTKDSTLYEGPFEVTAPGTSGGTVTVKAIGIRSGYTNSAVARVQLVFMSAKATIDEIINGARTDINNAMKIGDPATFYAALSELEDDHVTVNISDGTVQVTNVYTDIVQILVNALKENVSIVTTIHTGEEGSLNTLDLSKDITAEQIKAFVKASGLEGTGEGGEIMGSDVISCLYGQDMTATVTDINGATYDYTVTFRADVDKATIDEIIAGARTDINNAMKIGDPATFYAALSELEDDHVTVNISDGTVQVTNVYTDIVQILVNALKENVSIVTTIHTGEEGSLNTLDLSKDITAEQIKAFVKASGLEGTGEGGEIMGSDVISCLYGQDMTATVTDINGATYDYTVTFRADVDKATIDEIIAGARTDINNAMKIGDPATFYAALSELEDSHVTVNISNGTVNVSKVYTDIVQLLLEALKENVSIVTTIHTGEEGSLNTLDLSKDITAEQIKAFVKASGLEGTGEGGEIMGSDVISCLYGQDMTATVTDINGATYDYTVTFAKATE